MEIEIHQEGDGERDGMQRRNIYSYGRASTDALKEYFGNIGVKCVLQKMYMKDVSRGVQ